MSDRDPSSLHATASASGQSAGLMSAPRRQFITGTAAAAVASGLHCGVWAQGSDAPEKKEVRIGFIPLTDCASVVMASVLKFDEKYGIKIIPTKEASWAGVRDKLSNGELDAAHVLYGLIYGVQLGVGGPKKDMANLMSLNNNGQAISLSNQLRDKAWLNGWGGKMLRSFGVAKLSVVDVRPAASFNVGHVPFASNVPAEVFRRIEHLAVRGITIEARAAGIEQGDEIFRMIQHIPQHLQFPVL